MKHHDKNIDLAFSFRTFMWNDDETVFIKHPVRCIFFALSTVNRSISSPFLNFAAKQNCLNNVDKYIHRYITYTSC